MDGLLIINKPSGYTSRDIVNIVSKKFQTKKVGHTGTLDPMAEGVLVLCIGSATKLVDVLTDTYKEYIAEVTLGILTDTLDSEGKILKEDNKKITKDEIIEAVNSMKGTYIQEVPIYSAVKVNGKKLYEYAREGVSVTLPKREVDIKEISLLGDIEYGEHIKFKIKTTVSKGTYIRSLVSDIASKLNTIGIMSSLTRTKQGRFDIKDSHLIDEIDNNSIIPIDEALKDYYTVEVDEILGSKIINGVKIPNIYKEDIVLFKKDGISLALYKNDNNILRVYKMLYKR